MKAVGAFVFWRSPLYSIPKDIPRIICPAVSDPADAVPALVASLRAPEVVSSPLPGALTRLQVRTEFADAV